MCFPHVFAASYPSITMLGRLKWPSCGSEFASSNQSGTGVLVFHPNTNVAAGQHCTPGAASFADVHISAGGGGGAQLHSAMAFVP